MTKLVYFDSNIFGDIHATTFEVMQASIDQLQNAIENKKLSIIFSMKNFEEMLAILGKDGGNVNKAAQLIKSALKLVDLGKIVKESKRLLTDDIRAYASTGAAADPFYSG